MAYTITPAASSALEDAFVIRVLSDDHNNNYDPAICSAKYFGAPTWNELLGLLAGRVASKAYQKTWTCLAALAVGDAVYISANNTLTKADATTDAKARVIGFVRYKPTTTTCFLDHFVQKTGLSGGTADGIVYLTDAGGFGAAAGTKLKPLGVWLNTTDALCWASPESALIGGDLGGDMDGHLPSALVISVTGTTTNDSAAAGKVGEFVQTLVAVGSPVALTTAIGANVASISLTAGDWDVVGNVNLSLAAATPTILQGAISETSATIPTDGSEVHSGTLGTAITVKDSIVLPRKRISIASTTTIYLVAKATFSAGGINSYGQISARRVR